MGPPQTYTINTPISLKANQSLIGGVNTILQLPWLSQGVNNGYMINISPVMYSSIDIQVIKSKSPQTIIGIVSGQGIPSTFKVGAKVVLEGYSAAATNPAKQSLFSVISAINGTEITLLDPLTFTISESKSIKLIEQIDMNVNISNIKFTNIDLNNTSNFINVFPFCSNVKITNCTFTGSPSSNPNYKVNGIYSEESSISVTSCVFQNILRGDAIMLLNTGYSSIINNSINNAEHAITLFSTHNTIVNYNVITNDPIGRIYSTGIFLTGDPNPAWRVYLFGDKSCFNTISNNYVSNAGYGYAGSCNSGIHLHRCNNFNTISGNTCKYNGMGIYLETNNDNNIVANNQCSNNNRDMYAGNVYGIGIELDFDNDNNIIDHNECSYNDGIATDPNNGNNNWYGMTGMGIEVRNGYGSGHDNTNNVISNNTCSNNGSIGIKVAGTGSRVINNTIIDNGQNTLYSFRNGVLLNGKDIIFNNNTIVGGKVTMLSIFSE